MTVTRPHYLTATGDVGVADGGLLCSATLTPAAATATLTLREGGSTGAVILALQAQASGGSVQALFSGLSYHGQLHATLAGAVAAATVEL